MKPTKFRALGFTLAGITLAGCSEPTIDVPSQSAQPKTAVSVSLDSDKQVMPVAPSGLSVTTSEITAPKPLAGVVATEQTLHTINTFLIEYQANGGRIPDTVEAMVQAKIIPPIPPAPTGKRFSVDTKKALVTFADI